MLGFLLQIWGCLGYALRQIPFMLLSVKYVRLAWNLRAWSIIWVSTNSLILKICSRQVTWRTSQYCCFSELDPSFSVLKTKPLRFGNWLCSRLQLKMPVLLSLIDGASFLGHWMIDQVQRNSNAECNAPSLEPFRVIWRANFNPF
jgi:hypothetical protein